MLVLKNWHYVSVTYIEDGQTKTADGKIIKLTNGKNGIGISLIDRTEAKGDVPVNLRQLASVAQIAGMMFSLAIYLKWLIRSSSGTTYCRDRNH